MRRGPGNPIPGEQYALVRDREGGHCLRCSGRGGEWHHRGRRRERRSEHQHCACNGVWLCLTCHRWAHQHPVQAKAQGYIVASTELEPSSVAVVAWDGPVKLTCDGAALALTGANVAMDGGSPRIVA